MSEERPGQEPGETDDLDELLSDDEPEEEGDETEPEEGDETEPEPEGEAEPEPKPRQSRTERRIQTLLRRDKERDVELKQLRDAVIARQAAPPQQVDPSRQQQLDREEAERVAQLPYDEQARYWNRKTEERVNQQLLRGQLETRDMLDRQSFQQIIRDRRLPARYATQVEDLLAQARRENMNPSREWLLKAALGHEMLERKDRETNRQRVRGQRRIASQTTRPGGGARSTAANPGRRSQDTDADLDARLKGITVGEFTNLVDR